MSFSTPEFPGRVFNSVEELQEAREVKKRLEESLTGRTTVTVSNPEEGPEEWDSSGQDTKR